MPELTQTMEQTWTRPRAEVVVPLLIAAGYVIIEIVLFGFHEPWRDEGQAWLKAQELSTPLQFLIVPSEGHPPIWFWMLRLLSMVLSFDQARLLMLPVAALNAWLLAKLFGDRPILLVTLLLSLPILHSWGFHFRPYPLVLTCVAGALLLDRNGRPQEATSLLAISCGLSFFSGWLFAFWLLVQLQRRVPVRQLAGPAVLAAAFGISAVLSSLGNHDSGTHLGYFWISFFNGLALPFAIPDVDAPYIVVVTIPLIVYGLRKTPFMLGCVAILLLMLALFGALAYGLAEWHAAFGMMLVVMAFSLSKAPIWPLALLLLAQDFWGLRRAGFDVRSMIAADRPVYEAVVADAGDRLDPPRNLVAWPDYALTPTAASLGIRYISGNNGAVVGAIDWSARRHLQIDTKMLQTMPTPYWLICAECQRPLRRIYAGGRKATLIQPPVESIADSLSAFRIE